MKSAQYPHRSFPLNTRLRYAVVGRLEFAEGATSALWNGQYNHLIYVTPTAATGEG